MHRGALTSSTLLVLSFLVLFVPSSSRAEQPSRRCPRDMAQRLGSRWGDDLGASASLASPVPSSAAVTREPAVRRRPVAPAVDELSPDQLVLHLRLVEHHLAQLESLRTAGRLSPTYAGRVEELRRRQQHIYQRLSQIIASEP